MGYSYAMSTSANVNLAHGHGVATMAGSSILDVWYPEPALGPLTGEPDASLVAMALPDTERGVTRKVVSVEIDLDSAPTDALDAYLRLHLLSHRLVKPHGQVLAGIFGLLSNVVWTSARSGFSIGLKVELFSNLL